MKRGLIILLLAVGVWGGWVAWQKLFPPDEVLIQRLLDETARAISFSGQQKELSRLAGAAEMAGYFTDDVLVKISELGGEFGVIRGRTQLQQLALAARNQGASLSVQFLDVEVSVASKTEGSAVLVVQAKGGGRPEPFHQELNFSFRKVNGDWLISRVETVQSVRRVDGQ